MKIISLNTWQGGQKKELREYLENNKELTDIFLLQESSGETEVLRQELFLKEQSITTHKYEAAYDQEWCNTSILKNDVRLVAAGTFFVDHADAGHGQWLEVEKEEETYVICNIHGASSPNDKEDSPDRLAQTREILSFLEGYPGKHIIMGDFNLNPDTESVKLFERAGYRNLIREFGIDTTRNEIAWAQYPDNKQLFADYTFVSPEVTVKNFQVPKNEASDHLPMELEIA